MPWTEARLAHDRYWRADVFAAEAGAIFGRSWIHIGLAADFAAGPVVCDIAGVTVTVAPGAAEAWRGGDGTDDRGDPVRIDRCGALVFCCLSAETEALAAYLAPYGATLARLSAPFGAADSRERLEVPANWKTMIENTLDDYHVPAVHADSFRKPMHPDWPTRMTYERPGRHSVQQWDMNDEAVAVWRKLDRHVRFQRYSDYSGYRHYFIFPNFYISTAYGAMAVLHRILPLAPERSIIEWSICLPLAPPESGARQAIKASLVPGLAAEARRIVTEDVAICALAQQGRHFAPYPGMLGGREARVIDFQAAVVGGEGG